MRGPAGKLGGTAIPGCACTQDTLKLPGELRRRSLGKDLQGGFAMGELSAGLVFEWWHTARNGCATGGGCATNSFQEDAGGLVVWVLRDKLAFEGALQNRLSQAFGTYQV